ncbi:hypothetical protein [Ekhidna sp.]
MLSTRNKNIFYLLYFLGNFLFAQDFYIPKFDEIVEPSPQAATLGQYGFLPPNQYMGTPNIGISLYEIEFEELTIPLSLSYYMPGLRPNDEASWVGLGWSLNATSVITRSIKGRDDLLDQYSDIEIGWIFRKSLLELTDNPEDGYWDGSTQTLLSGSDLDRVDAGDDIDMEPDIWSVSLFGKSIKFILGHYSYPDPEIEVIVLNEKNYKISFNKDTKIFKVIDNIGYEYIFDLILTSNGIGSNVPGTWKTPSSWYLSKIISPNSTGKSIEFNYSSKIEVKSGRNWFQYGKANYNILQGNWTGQTAPQFQVPCDPFFNSSLYSNSGFGPSKYYIGLNYSLSEEVYLTSIINGPEKVEFNTSDREDLETKEANEHAQKLDNISIYFGSELKKRIGFNFSYFNQSNTYTKKTHFYRLKLDGLSAQERRYTFSYSSTNNLPSKETQEFDWWGYYNGKDPNGWLFPPHSDYTSSWAHNTTTGFYRSPDSNYSIKGVLNRITYPTGGYTQYIYEPNDVQLRDNSIYEWEDSPELTPNGPKRNVEIGGLRISKVKDYDIDGTLTKTHEYNYTDANDTNLSSGLLLDEEMRFRNDYEVKKVYNTLCDGLDSPFPSGTGCKAQYSQLSSNPITSIHSIADGSFYGYSRVEELIIDINDASNSYKIISEFVNKPYQVSVIAPYSDKAISYFGSGGCHEYLKPLSIRNVKWPRSLSENNGKIDYQEMYDSDGVKIKSIDYNYLSLGTNERYYAGVKSFGGYTSGGPIGTNTKLVAFQNYPVSIRKPVLGSMIEVTHFNTRDLTSSTGYSYNSKWLPKSKTYSTSDGDALVTKYYYPVDYTDHDIAFDLVQSNIVAKPIKIEEVKKGNLISGTVYDYDAWGKPTEEYRYESDDLKAPEAHDPESLIPSGYSSINEISYVGSKVSQIESRSGINKSYIWGYNHRYPIAIAENANKNEIGYSSFESGFDSWEVSYGTVPDDGVTGKKCIEPIDASIKSKHQFPPGTYRISMYSKNINGTGGTISIQNYGGIAPFWPGNNEWKYDERIVTLNNTEYLTFESSAQSGIYIDDLKVMPIDAEMTTYTYDPLIGITHVVDPNGKIHEYQYDEKGRLIEIRDPEGMLLKSYEYHLTTD